MNLLYGPADSVEITHVSLQVISNTAISLLGVFSIKRELKAVEVGKLRQSIYQLENEAKESGE